ncbi:ribokinase [Microbacterium candidum]|uniref:Ribokinase n=1 Tax=Microbacterium candidum TaxID=3041922 RepID=A0ABT7MVF8_9MICO|nr:ribokinase [Microbacterium sp. ASV49]MDL9978434.1 ribokinase [Microbacterium sp. ASV49]
MVSNVMVLGSANADLVVEVPRRPSGGETLLGSDLHLFPGGKGANQAAAAARAGAATRFLGCVGRDAHADFLLQNLADAGVEVDGVRRGERPTGTAMILLTPDGENSIVVSPGANYSIDVAMAEELAPAWLAADVLVLNLEVPLETVVHVVGRAAAEGVRVLLNAAPAAHLDPVVLQACDPLVVNEYEARIVLGSDREATFEELAADLLAAGARSVVITLGAAGAVVGDADGVEVVPAHRVEVVDTTGAGDAFVGATACELARGANLRDAVRFATAMSAIAVTSKGAQSSYPDRDAVEAFIREAARA